MKFIRYTKKIIKILLLAMLFGIIYSLFFTVYENIKVDSMISTFKKRAGNDPVLVLNIEDEYVRKYWEVPRETFDEINDKKNVFEDEEKQMLGRYGDIFATRQSPFPNVWGFHQFMSYYYGGHAAIKSESTKESGKKEKFVEATGYPNSDESIFDIIFSNGKKGHGFSPTASENGYNYWYQADDISDNYYFEKFYRSRYIGLRVKNPFINENNADALYNNYLDLAVDRAREKIDNDALYNFLFFLNMRRKYYCTDFVSRVYEEAYYSAVLGDDNYRSTGYAKKLNDDGFITSVNDLILSNDTYIHFYVEINEEIYDGNKTIVQNIYYLEDIE
ncbi:hypothetical protein [Haploplasma axanthum]|uniref:Uncharacterized protein n=1 Tax=Haploplasma axanthum TaxID=29552 RepID=A0A449BBX7_HAPAX|nr:hypothetical protein [Haploplasma axanthum]VEU79947.1 Uncharacterised protein [Haploplasma axanthum]